MTRYGSRRGHRGLTYDDSSLAGVEQLEDVRTGTPRGPSAELLTIAGELLPQPLGALRGRDDARVGASARHVIRGRYIGITGELGKLFVLRRIYFEPSGVPLAPASSPTLSTKHITGPIAIRAPSTISALRPLRCPGYFQRTGCRSVCRLSVQPTANRWFYRSPTRTSSRPNGTREFRLCLEGDGKMRQTSRRLCIYSSQEFSRLDQRLEISSSVYPLVSGTTAKI